MRYRREQQYNQLNRSKQTEEDCSWNSIIVWGICISVIILIILYLAFGPNIYKPPTLLVGSVQVAVLDEEKMSLPVFEGTISINGNSIYYRYVEPRGQKGVQPDVLLLHGKKYGSKTWKGVGTLQILAWWGYKTYAIDLPGYQLSKKATAPSDTYGRKEFMESLIDKLRLKKVVIITPSMSGLYGLPILLEDSNVDLRCFVAISPENTPKYKREQYQSVDVPVLVMYGERDKTPAKDEMLYWMENIPDHTNVMVQKAEHAAFVGNPEGFHNDILRFLSSQCTIGEDTETDNDLDSIYDNDDYFGYDTNSDTSSSTYYGDSDSSTTTLQYDQYLQKIFAEDYYDDSELYFDNEGLTEDGVIDLDTDYGDYGDDDTTF